MKEPKFKLRDTVVAAGEGLGLLEQGRKYIICAVHILPGRLDSGLSYLSDEYTYDLSLWLPLRPIDGKLAEQCLNKNQTGYQKDAPWIQAIKFKSYIAEKYLQLSPVLDIFPDFEIVDFENKVLGER
ncbi:MAG: hypothetical protein F6K54_32660 [Okeania sp. SIO3B5]|uniref:hypothetical protein n=1 Tax=Okeania sp. SIO3B5 TaxID=2607811 RepID=UPI0013FE733C|nr:hypothetical protein [Okeania sp. SIO3B5]NEO57414.1 hypothetical protein [Okeania sp. SIO3B5]